DAAVGIDEQQGGRRRKTGSKRLAAKFIEATLPQRAHRCKAKQQRMRGLGIAVKRMRGRTRYRRCFLPDCAPLLGRARQNKVNCKYKDDSRRTNHQHEELCRQAANVSIMTNREDGSCRHRVTSGAMTG